MNDRIESVAHTHGHRDRERGLGTSFVEFVALSALLMAMTALSIDIMLPALPQIGASFALGEPNHRQLVVTSYLIGFAGGQLVFGPLSDRLGRKPVLMAGLVIFVAGTLVAVVVDEFALLFLARTLQGLGGAAPRVISVAVVRDLFSGRRMARVMSLVMMVFIAVPVFAPAIGQGLLHIGAWRLTFYFLAAVGLVAIVWAGLRLPETHPPGQSAAPVALIESARRIVSTPQTVGYAVAAGFLFGCLMAYIGSAQQIFVEIYGLGTYFPVAFGAVAGVQSLAAFVNSRLVERHGMRRVSHTALVAYCTASLLLVLAAPFDPPLLLFAGLVASAFFSFGVIVPNFNAIAMQPLGALAGTASSAIGFYMTAAGALFGWAIGALFDGTVLPLAAGFAVLSFSALATVILTEGLRGLFRGE